MTYYKWKSLAHPEQKFIGKLVHWVADRPYYVAMYIINDRSLKPISITRRNGSRQMQSVFSPDEIQCIPVREADLFLYML